MKISAGQWSVYDLQGHGIDSLIWPIAESNNIILNKILEWINQQLFLVI